ncbi:MAG: 1,2-phenylacetyl-CoA epoxidase subunit PaaD [Chitinophagaceae bacterium]
MKSVSDVKKILAQVSDPEVPVLTLEDLGVIRDVHVHSDTEVTVLITPTYTGCPAMDMMTSNIRMELMSHGFKQIIIHQVLSPAWTTDWMSEAGKKKLKAYGICPPQYRVNENPHYEAAIVPCPRCDSKDTELISQHGSTACKALYKCLDCLEPFDYFKCH